VNTIQQTKASVSSDSLDLKVRVQSLEDKIKDLESYVEKTTHANDNEQKNLLQNIADIKSSVADYEKKLKSIESREPVKEPAPPKIEKPEPEQTKEPVVAPGKKGLELHRSGVAAFDKKDYQKTIDELSEFLKNNPNNEFADKSIYYIGKAQYELKRYEIAIDEFQKLLEKYPKSEFKCWALLKQAESLLALNKKEESTLFLNHVVDTCKSKAPVLKIANGHLAKLTKKKK